jgi:hypothetical protein
MPQTFGSSLSRYAKKKESKQSEIMRIGRVIFRISYVVDLDNPDQVELAKDYILEDLTNAVKFSEETGYIGQEEDSTLTEKDIGSAIKEYSDELEQGDEK